jgi:hypothetical protein
MPFTEHKPSDPTFQNHYYDFKKIKIKIKIGLFCVMLRDIRVPLGDKGATLLKKIQNKNTKTCQNQVMFLKINK